MLWSGDVKTANSLEVLRTTMEGNVYQLSAADIARTYAKLFDTKSRIKSVGE